MYQRIFLYVFRAVIVAAVITGCSSVKPVSTAERFNELVFMAYEQLSENRPHDALSTLKDAIAINKADYHAHMLEALAYEMLSEYESAIDALIVARKLDSEVREIHYNLGNNYFITDNYPAAIRSYGEALSIDDRFSEAYLNRANAYMKMKNYRLALDDYRRYQVLTNGVNANVSLIITKLEELLRKE
jgi:Tfp pilus assembly protein PilF